MAKYRGNQPYYEKAPDQIGAGISAGLQSYNQAKQQEELQKKLANFDKLPKIQQAMLIAEVAGQPAAAAHVKAIGQQQEREQFFGGQQPTGGVQNILPGETVRPNQSQLLNAIESMNQLQPNVQGQQQKPPVNVNVPIVQTGQPIQQPQQQSQQSNASKLAQMTDDQLKEGIARFPQVAPALEQELKDRREARIAQQNKEKFQQNIFEKDRDWNTKMSDDFRKYIIGIKRSIPQTEAALSLSRTAIESGELGAWSANNLAGILGRPELLTASGAALNLAAKENLLGNLARVSGRAQNKWLEQVAIGAFPRAGQSLAANLTVQEGIEADLALRKAKAEAYDLISEQDMKKQGYEGADIEKRVNAAIQPVEDEILKRTAYRTRSIYEQEKGPKELAKIANKQPPTGTPLTRGMFQVYFNKTDKNLDIQERSKAAIKKAKQLGYVIYPDAKVQEYTQ